MEEERKRKLQIESFSKYLLRDKYFILTRPFKNVNDLRTFLRNPKVIGENVQKSGSKRQFMMEAEIPSQILATTVCIYETKKKSNQELIEELIFTYVVNPFIQKYSPFLYQFFTSTKVVFQMHLPEEKKEKSLFPDLILPEDISSLFQDALGDRLVSLKKKINEKTNEIEYQSVKNPIDCRVYIFEKYGSMIEDRYNRFLTIYTTPQWLGDHTTLDRLNEEDREAVKFQLLWTLTCFHRIGINLNELIFDVLQYDTNGIRPVYYFIDENHCIIRKDKVFVKLKSFLKCTWPGIIINNSFTTDINFRRKDQFLNQTNNNQTAFDLILLLEQFSPSINSLHNTQKKADILLTTKDTIIEESMSENYIDPPKVDRNIWTETTLNWDTSKVMEFYLFENFFRSDLQEEDFAKIFNQGIYPIFSLPNPLSDDISQIKKNIKFEFEKLSFA